MLRSVALKVSNEAKPTVVPMAVKSYDHRFLLSRARHTAQIL